MQDSLLQYFGESEITFDNFVIQTPSGSVTFKGEPVKLEPQVFTFLLLLIRHKEHIVSREEIVAEVWSGKSASDDAIRALVKKLRIALGDNARAPKFLKTVPLKGYLFIMPVEINFHQGEWWRSKYVFYAGGAVLVIALTLLIQSQFGTFQSKDPAPKREVISTLITQIKGNEVSPYLSKNDRLLFSHQGSNESYLQVFAKELGQGAAKRLTWARADFTNGILSLDGRQAIVTRTDEAGESIVLFDLDEKLNLVSTQSLALDPALLTQNIAALSYANNGKSLFLYGQAKAEDGKANYGLIKYDLDTKASRIVTLPMSSDARVIAAKESADGRLLGVLANHSNSAVMIVMNQEVGELVVSKRLPSKASSFVWSPNSESVSIATTNNKLLNLHIQKQRLYEWTGLPTPISKVISQCSEYCFVVQELGQRSVDVIERPAVFERIDYMSTAQFANTSVDFFPSYFNQGEGVYFLSLSDDKLQLNQYLNQGESKTVFDLPQSESIESMVLSPDEQSFVGELDHRLFSYSVKINTLRFLNVPATSVSNPVWSLDSQKVYYLARELNTANTINDQPAQWTNKIYAHDMSSNKSELIAEGLTFLMPLNQQKWLAINEANEAFFVEDTLLFAEPVFSASQLDQQTKITEIAHYNANNFSLLNDTLYFTKEENEQTMLLSLPINQGAPTEKLRSWVLSGTMLLPQLDIHPNGQKMLLVESALNQSNLMKVDGLTLSPLQVRQVATETP